jgi:hypothetical protein
MSILRLYIFETDTDLAVLPPDMNLAGSSTPETAPTVPRSLQVPNYILKDDGIIRKSQFYPDTLGLPPDSSVGVLGTTRVLSNCGWRHLGGVGVVVESISLLLGPEH